MINTEGLGGREMSSEPEMDWKGLGIILVMYCCLTNYPKTQWLAMIHYFP